MLRGLRSSVGIATELRGWTVRGPNPGGGEIFRTCPDWPWGPPSLLYNVYRVFRVGEERPERGVDPSPTSSAVVYGPYVLYRASVPVQYSYTSTPLWAVRPVQSLNACTRVHFTFTLPTCKWLSVITSLVLFQCELCC